RVVGGRRERCLGAKATSVIRMRLDELGWKAGRNIDGSLVLSLELGSGRRIVARRKHVTKESPGLAAGALVGSIIARQTAR
ncbi:MAG: hypothetical protein WBW99_00380, partial [Pseudolabrys sp.]